MVRRLPPLTRRSVRPLLRLVVSNPGLVRPRTAARRRHLTLVGAAVAAPRLAGFDAPPADPWTETESRSQMMVVLGLAAAGLVALATSIGRFLSLSI